MATTSGATALAGTRPPCAVDAPRSRRPAGHRLLAVVGQVTAFVWGAPQPVLPAPDARRRVALAGITGLVAAGVHPAPVPPADKRAAVAHYRALAEQVASERRGPGTGTLQVRGGAHDA